MRGKVPRVIDGPVSSEIEIGGGNIISAIITHTSCEKLELKKGETA